MSSVVMPKPSVAEDPMATSDTYETTNTEAETIDYGPNGTIPFSIRERLETLRDAVVAAAASRGKRDFVSILALDVNVAVRRLRESWNPRANQQVNDFVMLWDTVHQECVRFATGGTADLVITILRDLRLLLNFPEFVPYTPFPIRVQKVFYFLSSSRRQSLNETMIERDMRASVCLCLTSVFLLSIIDWSYSLSRYEDVISVQPGVVWFVALLCLFTLRTDFAKPHNIMIAMSVIVMISPLFGTLLPVGNQEHITVRTCGLLGNVFVCMIGLRERGTHILLFMVCAFVTIFAFLLQGYDVMWATPVLAMSIIVLVITQVQLTALSFRVQDCNLAGKAMFEYRNDCLKNAMAQMAVSEQSLNLSLGANSGAMNPLTPPLGGSSGGNRSGGGGGGGYRDEVSSIASSLDVVHDMPRDGRIIIPAEMKGQPTSMSYTCSMKSFRNVLFMFGTFANGTVAYWSDGLETLVGYTSAEALGENIFQLLPLEETSYDVLSSLYKGSSDTITRINLMERRKMGSSSYYPPSTIVIGCVECIEGKLAGGEVSTQSLFFFFGRISTEDTMKNTLSILRKNLSELDVAMAGETSPLEQIDTVKHSVRKLLDIVNTPSLARVNLKAVLSCVLSEHPRITKQYQTVLRCTHKDVVVDLDNLNTYFSKLLSAVIVGFPSLDDTDSESSCSGVTPGIGYQHQTTPQRQLHMLYVHAAVDNGMLRITVERESRNEKVRGDVRPSRGGNTDDGDNLKEYKMAIPVHSATEGKEEALNVSPPQQGSTITPGPRPIVASKQFRTVVLGGNTFNRFLSEILFSRGHVVFAVDAIQSVQSLLGSIDMVFVQLKHFDQNHGNNSLPRSMSRSSGRSSLTSVNPASQQPGIMTLQQMNVTQSILSTLDVIKTTLRRKSVVICLDAPHTAHQEWSASGYVVMDLPAKTEVVHDITKDVEHRIVELQNSTDQMQVLRQVFKKANHGQWSRDAVLGQGTSATVYKATSVLTGGTMAVKCIPTTSMAPGTLITLLQEIDTFITLSHPNCIQYFYVERVPMELHVFMEFANEGTLRNRILSSTPILTPEFVQLTDDIAAGLEFLHSRNIVHRDLKSENVLISRGVAKVADFGSARVTSGTRNELAGTPFFIAPEIIAEGAPGDSRSDVWSLGCVMWEMLTKGQKPFSHKAPTWGDLVLYLTKCYRENVDPDTTPIDGAVGSSIVKDCVRISPADRPTVTQVRNALRGLDLMLMDTSTSHYDYTI
eukprot:PhF_6_TR10000/c0_g1_i2/m.15221